MIGKRQRREQEAMIGEKIDLESAFDAQRQAVRSYMATTPAVWELRAQLCTNLEDMPVEKPDKAWPEDKSPYVAVARLEAETSAQATYKYVPRPIGEANWAAQTAARVAQ